MEAPQTPATPPSKKLDFRGAKPTVRSMLFPNAGGNAGAGGQNRGEREGLGADGETQEGDRAVPHRSSQHAGFFLS